MFKIWLRSISFLFDEKKLTLFIITFGALVSFIGIYEQVLFGQVVDSLAQKQNTLPLVIKWGAIGLVGICAQVFISVMADRLSHRRKQHVMQMAFEKAISLQTSYHLEKGSGAVVRSLWQGTSSLFWLWLPFLRQQLSAFVSLIILVPTAIRMDWRMSALLGALMIIFFIVNFVVLRRASGNQEKIEHYHSSIYGRVGDVLGNISIIQSYTQIENEIKEIKKLSNNLLKAQYPVLTYWGVLTVLKQSATTLTMVIVFGMGAWLVQKGEMSVGYVVSFVGFAQILIGKLEQISDFFVGTFEQTPVLKSFFSILDTEPTIEDRPGAKELSTVRGDIEFKNVSFKYKDSPQGVFNLNFSVKAGETVALVGKTGAGKTTALTLLQRIFDPQEGQITIDGIDSRDIKMRSLRQNLAVVFQEAGLLNRSIYENIQLGNLNASQEQIISAAENAEAIDFIESKKNKLDFVIGERGAHLSGGERQRLAIARAFLKDAPVLVLDEATSALDNITEFKVKKAFDRVRKNRTTFIIAHRLSTVMSADKILVLDNGRIVDSGTYEELKSRINLFQEFPLV